MWGIVGLVWLLYSVATVSSVEVHTQYGVVKGQEVPLVSYGKSVNSFLGIPFAKPPVGDLRWQAPVHPETWDGVLNADKYSSSCVQNPGITAPTHIGYNDYSEDCLYLNIYTPKNIESGKKYPVFFWIYGGGFTKGTNIMFPGHFLAARDVVVVVPNYRVGVIGFLSTLDNKFKGNYGLLDLVKAMKFVQKNIYNFGGDPGMVTIAGESAGAGAVGLLVVSPMAKGLFHQAIYQSGSDLRPESYRTVEQKPGTLTVRLAEQVQCPTSDTQAIIDCLRKRPATQLTELSPNIWCEEEFPCFDFAPVVDGSFLPESPEDLRKKGDFQKVPTIIGKTREEGSFFLLGFGSRVINGFTKEELREFLSNQTELVLGMKYPPSTLEKVKEALQFYYSPWGRLENRAANRDQMTELISDFNFGYADDIVAKVVSRHSHTYSYLFKHYNANNGFLGAFHSYDLPFTFGWNLVFTNPAVLEESRFTHDFYNFTSTDAAMAEIMMDMWTAFAKTGNPTPEAIKGPEDVEGMTWPLFEEKTQRTLIFDKCLGEVHYYKQRNYAFFTQYIPHLLGMKPLWP